MADCMFKGVQGLFSPCGGKVADEVCILWFPGGKTETKMSPVCMLHKARHKELVFQGISEGKTLIGFKEEQESDSDDIDDDYWDWKAWEPWGGWGKEPGEGFLDEDSDID